MSDILLQRDNPTTPQIDTSFDIRYADMSNGSWAEVIYYGASGAIATTDILVAHGSPIGGVQMVTRYRDMGDGSFAEVVYCA